MTPARVVAGAAIFAAVGLAIVVWRQGRRLEAVEGRLAAPAAAPAPPAEQAKARIIDQRSEVTIRPEVAAAIGTRLGKKLGLDAAGGAQLDLVVRIYAARRAAAQLRGTRAALAAADEELAARDLGAAVGALHLSTAQTALLYRALTALEGMLADEKAAPR